MACWVLPAIAAEIWHLPLETVLERARDGALLSKTENGYLFIDTGNDGERHDAAARLPPPIGGKPPTFVIVSPEELAALMDPHDRAKFNHDDWHVGRRQIAQSRKAPPPPSQPPSSLPSESPS